MFRLLAAGLQTSDRSAPFDSEDIHRSFKRSGDEVLCIVGDIECLDGSTRFEIAESFTRLGDPTIYAPVLRTLEEEVSIVVNLDDKHCTFSTADVEWSHLIFFFF